jgi:hypothetical protein
MITNIEGEKVKLPYFLIVGAAKSGTTSLYYYLGQHPRVFMPGNKEPWFFASSSARVSELGKKGMIKESREYSELFKDAQSTQVLGEASTGYLYLYDDTISNLRRYHPGWKDLKIIMILLEEHARRGPF